MAFPSTKDVLICNNALFKIGAEAISGVTELDISTAITKAGKILSTIYAQIRDELLTAHQWNFAKARQLIRQDVIAPVYDYKIRYETPSDNLRVLSINIPPMPNNVQMEWEREQDYLLTNYATNVAYNLTTATLTETYNGDGTYTLTGSTDIFVNVNAGYYISNTVAAVEKIFQISSVSQTTPYSVVTAKQITAIVDASRAASTNFKYAVEPTFTEQRPMYCKYIQQVTDAAKFSPMFCELFSFRLAMALAYPMLQSNTLSDKVKKDMQDYMKEARNKNGQESSQINQGVSSDFWMNSRHGSQEGGWN